VLSPSAKGSERLSAETLRKQIWKHAHEPAAVKAWRERMASEAGKAVYRRRKLTEHAHAKLKGGDRWPLLPPMPGAFPQKSLSGERQSSAQVRLFLKQTMRRHGREHGTAVTRNDKSPVQNAASPRRQEHALLQSRLAASKRG
jgi:hypothetical protein